MIACFVCQVWHSQLMRLTYAHRLRLPVVIVARNRVTQSPVHCWRFSFTRYRKHFSLRHDISTWLANDKSTFNWTIYFICSFADGIAANHKSISARLARTLFHRHSYRWQRVSVCVHCGFEFEERCIDHRSQQPPPPHTRVKKTNSMQSFDLTRDDRAQHTRCVRAQNELNDCFGPNWWVHCFALYVEIKYATHVNGREEIN